MFIGVPKEIKNHEYRVALTPAGAERLVKNGVTVLVEKDAGLGSGFSDSEYECAGAKIVSAKEAWGVNQKDFMVIKIKEPLLEEYQYLKEGLILFTYLHLASDRRLTRVLMEKKVTAIAYETVERKGNLPLLIPMSEVAGRMAPVIGAFYAQRTHGGNGVLPGGISGVAPSTFLVIGGGIVGTNAAITAAGLGARVIIMDCNQDRLRHLNELLQKNCITLFSSYANIAAQAKKAHVIIGAVLIPGAKAPKLLTYDIISTMKHGSVIVDVAIDQGGIADISWPPTSHDKPVRYISRKDPRIATENLDEAREYEEGFVIAYLVPNMPGAYARTATLGITNATLPYVMALAINGPEKALRKDPQFAKGLNVHRGKITYRTVADTHKF